jgi:hypothetical protein
MTAVLNNKKVVAALAGLAVVVALVAFWMLRRNGTTVATDLVAMLPEAVKRSTWDQPGDEPFTVKSVTLAGEAHQAIFAPPHARIRWKVEVPRRGTLEFYYGVREDGWTGEGNGVQFRVGISDGRTYEEYLREVVHPQARVRDRRWLSATIDLSAYEGQLVELNFNTDPGPPKDDQDRRHDFALWGEPRIIGH